MQSIGCHDQLQCSFRRLRALNQSLAARSAPALAQASRACRVFDEPFRRDGLISCALLLRSLYAHSNTQACSARPGQSVGAVAVQSRTKKNVTAYPFVWMLRPWASHQTGAQAARGSQFSILVYTVAAGAESASRAGCPAGDGELRPTPTLAGGSGAPPAGGGSAI